MRPTLTSESLALNGGDPRAASSSLRFWQSAQPCFKLEDFHQLAQLLQDRGFLQVLRCNTIGGCPRRFPEI